MLKLSSFVESVVEAVDCCRLLCALENSTFVAKADESIVKAVDCCRLLCALYSSTLVEAV